MASARCPECDDIAPITPGDLIREGWTARRWRVGRHPDQRRTETTASGIVLEYACTGEGRLV